MGQHEWVAVERYFADRLFPRDAALDDALEASVAAGLPPIAVSAAQGRLLQLIARMVHARRVLEIGTLGGYSTIWLARALPPDGRIVTIEVDPHHADVARRNVAGAGLTGRVDLRVGPALDVLPVVEAEGLAPFDLVFVDGDKPHYAEYLDWSIRLARPGTVIIVDNVVRDGRILETSTTDPAIRGVQRFNDRLAAERRVTATAIQIVGAKSYDGFVMMIVETA